MIDTNMTIAPLSELELATVSGGTPTPAAQAATKILTRISYVALIKEAAEIAYDAGKAFGRL